MNPLYAICVTCPSSPCNIKYVSRFSLAKPSGIKKLAATLFLMTFFLWCIFLELSLSSLDLIDSFAFFNFSCISSGCLLVPSITSS